MEECKLKKMTVDANFWEVFPEAKINLLVVKDINNIVDEADDPKFEAMLKQGKREAKKFLGEETFTQNVVIAEWREAFAKFKTKKGARSSIEALLKRVNQDKDFRPISPLVDIYNTISLTYAVPCGGEDLMTIQGDLHLGKATGGESFFPLGAEKDAPALPEEIIYYDDEGAICRSFNWREAKRTMLQETTKDAVLVIEAINPDQAKRADEAILALQTAVKDYFGVQGEIHEVTVNQSSVVIY